MAVALVLGGIGCAGQTKLAPKASADAPFFAPATMHLSPVFTKVGDFDGDNSLDGIEAVVELQDRFGDPTKAAGRFLFQVYRYKPYNPDPRGERVAGPFEGRVDSVQDQRARWSRVSRAYIFQLAFPNAALSGDYVLETMFETASGQRLSDRLTIEGDHEKTAPTTGPSPLTPGTTEPATTSSSAVVVPGSVVTQEPRRVPTTSQPHEPPPRSDQP